MERTAGAWHRAMTLGVAATVAYLFNVFHRQAVAAREESRRANDLKDALLASVSHELRTPLNVIIGWVQVMKSGKLAPEETTRALAAIEQNAALEARRVTDLLDISRLMQGQMRLSMANVDLRAVLGEAVTALQAEAD